MAFDEGLADRVRETLAGREGLTERKMFGGIGFMLNGNMAVGVHGDELIVRIAPERTDEALAKPHTRVFDMTGRPMKGWLLVDSEADLDAWIAEGAAYASSLPPK
jgi:TfoX/Sxy family transcriptional regulator of competence genes